MYYTLFFICILTRIATSIYYIEDIDSLRFAYSVADEYSIKNLQPHFPGYPIFSFIGKLIYLLTGNLGLSFSIIGGIALFIIIISSLKLTNMKINSKNGMILTSFILLNPMFWLMSNRYMPDLLGLACTITVICLLISTNSNFSKFVGFFLAGILIGLRLSYFPILLAPIFYIIKRSYNLKFLISFTIGILMWLIPLIYIEGFISLYNSAYKHTIGHFFDFGGSIITESNIFLRLKYLAITVWSDGLGLFYSGRSWLTILPTIPIIFLTFQLITNYKLILKQKGTKWLLISMIIYIIWILLSQNLIYKSRHVLPLILFIIIFICSLNKYKILKVISFLYILSISIITFKLVENHKNETAISHLSKYTNVINADIIISNPLINYYLKSQKNNAKLLNIEKYDNRDLKVNDNKNIVLIGYYSELFKNYYENNLDTIFYHNPYMNRMWSEIPVYTLTKKDKIDEY